MTNILMETAQDIKAGYPAYSTLIKLIFFVLGFPALFFGMSWFKKRGQGKGLKRGKDANLEEVAASIGVALHLNMNEVATAIAIALSLYKNERSSAKLTIKRIAHSPWKEINRARSMERL